MSFHNGLYHTGSHFPVPMTAADILLLKTLSIAQPYILFRQKCGSGQRYRSRLLYHTCFDNTIFTNFDKSGYLQRACTGSLRYAPVTVIAKVPVQYLMHLELFIPIRLLFPRIFHFFQRFPDNRTLIKRVLHALYFLKLLL